MKVKHPTREGEKDKRMPQLEPLYFINSISWTYMIFVINYIIISKIFLPLNLRTLLIRLTLIGK